MYNVASVIIDLFLNVCLQTIPTTAVCAPECPTLPRAKTRQTSLRRWLATPWCLRHCRRTTHHSSCGTPAATTVAWVWVSLSPCSLYTTVLYINTPPPLWMSLTTHRCTSLTSLVASVFMVFTVLWYQPIALWFLSLQHLWKTVLGQVKIICCARVCVFMTKTNYLVCNGLTVFNVVSFVLVNLNFC